MNRERSWIIYKDEGEEEKKEMGERTGMQTRCACFEMQIHRFRQIASVRRAARVVCVWVCVCDVTARFLPLLLHECI